MIVIIGHHIIQTLLYSLLLCLPSLICPCSLSSINLVFSLIKNQFHQHPLSHLIHTHTHTHKKLSTEVSTTNIIMAELINKPPHIQEFTQKLNKSSPHHRELLKARLLVLSTGLPTKKAAISYGGNILADIECIQTMQTIDKPQAKALETKFRDLYSLPFDSHVLIVKAPKDLISTSNILATTKILAPWAENQNDKQTVGYQKQLKDFVQGWLLYEKQGTGMDYLKGFKLEHVRNWYIGTMKDGFDVKNSWDGFGLESL